MLALVRSVSENGEELRVGYLAVMVGIVVLEDSGDGSLISLETELLVDGSELVNGDETRSVLVVHVEVVLDFSVRESLVRHCKNYNFGGSGLKS